MSQVQIAVALALASNGLLLFLLVREKLIRQRREELWWKWHRLWERTAQTFAVKVQKSEPFSLEDVRVIRRTLLKDGEFRLSLFAIDDVVPMHFEHRYLLNIWREFGMPQPDENEGECHENS